MHVLDPRLGDWAARMYGWAAEELAGRRLPASGGGGGGGAAGGGGAGQRVRQGGVPLVHGVRRLRPPAGWVLWRLRPLRTRSTRGTRLSARACVVDVPVLGCADVPLGALSVDQARGSLASVVLLELVAERAFFLPVLHRKWRPGHALHASVFKRWR
eukprot:scaffold42123_cov78-Phaeocystis_antarctica.AAC.1